MLIFHFIGLAMGLGTGFGNAFLGVQFSRHLFFIACSSIILFNVSIDISR
jgi:hypothetical protein